MAASNPPFVELAAKSNYCFLEGASFPEELVAEAKALGYSGMGIVDRFGVYGAPRAHVAAKEFGLPLIIGAEVQIEGTRLLLLAQNRAGYGNLCELLTQAHDDRENPHLKWDALWPKADSLYALYPSDQAAAPPPVFQEAFSKRAAVLVSQFLDGQDAARLRRAQEQIGLWGLPGVASNEPLFHKTDRKPLQDVLACIRHGATLRNAGTKLLPNAERYLKTRAQMQTLFAAFPQWVQQSVEIADQCRFSLDEIRYRYPTEWIPKGETGDTYLRKLALEGLTKRYGATPSSQVYALLERELALIQELQYSDYFLTIWDIVCFARSEGILCQGRGSAANSLVCYLLGITSIDPDELNLLFERFVSRERREPPDIDIDFEHERREEVIQYIYRRYGRHRAAITAEVICFRRKSALREVAKVFEIPIETVERVQSLTHRRKLADVPKEQIDASAPGIPPRKLSQYFQIVQALLSFPRHLGTHVGGFVLCQDALTRNVPVEKAAMENRTIVQWDKNDLDALGFVRVDILGLGILTAIRKTFSYVQEVHGKAYTLADIKPTDPEVYKPLWRADTVGVFQIESRAQMNMLPRLRPENFYDLVVEVSLVRPGPIQGDMVHPYLKRRMGEEPVDYPHPDVKEILKKTFGVPLFQEQIMKIAMVVAGFTGGEADELRRAMGAWRRDGHHRLAKIGGRFRQGLIQKGIQQDYAERIFKQIEGFAEYGFPESHAASFAVLVYATAYLKHYYPAAFLTGLLNALPMGFYSAHTLIQDGIRHGVRVQPIDVQASDWDHRLENPKEVRLGYREVRGLHEKVGRAVEACRREKLFTNLEDLIDRVAAALLPTPLTKRDLFALAAAGALQGLKMDRRQALWKIQSLQLADSHAFQAVEASNIPLPQENAWDKITADFEAQGISFLHPLAFLRPDLKSQGLKASRDLSQLREGARIKTAGMVICRQQPPTASGVLFITLEDEFGVTHLGIWNKIYEKYRDALLDSSFLYCEGRIQHARGGNVLHVVVDKATPLLEQAIPNQSRNFH
ncbi:error-prone DNA polymerase [bacterium]|nr:error-prone DNA polymerase [bacterium]